MSEEVESVEAFIPMRLIENYNTGSFGGIRHYEMTLNSQQIEHPNADIVILTDYAYDKRPGLTHIWVPGFVHHGDIIYKVTAVVRAYSRREIRGNGERVSYECRLKEMTRTYGDHTTFRDMTLQIKDYEPKDES